MIDNTTRRSEVWKRIGLIAVTCVTISISAVGLGAAAANADVIRPDTDVSSPQADKASRGATRSDATQGEVRAGRPGEVSAQGEVRDSMQAQPDRGTRGKSFKGPWGGANNLNQFKFLGQNPY